MFRLRLKHRMRFTTFGALLLSFVFLATAQDVSLDVVKQTFDDANISEDASITFDPTVLFELSFPQTSGDVIPVTAGVQLPRNSTAGPPIFAISNSTFTPEDTFVVAAVDLDAPTPQDPTSAQIRHFLGGDFHVDDSGTLVNSTAAVSEFRQPTPPAGSDPHRYVFLLFTQSAGFETQTLVTPDTSIANFNISDFASAVGLGDPLGGTFILVGPDPNA